MAMALICKEALPNPTIAGPLIEIEHKLGPNRPRVSELFNVTLDRIRDDALIRDAMYEITDATILS